MCLFNQVWVSVLQINAIKIISRVQLMRVDHLASVRSSSFFEGLTDHRTDTCSYVVLPQPLLIRNIYSSCLVLTLKTILVFMCWMCLATNISFQNVVRNAHYQVVPALQRCTIHTEQLQLIPFSSQFAIFCVKIGILFMD